MKDCTNCKNEVGDMKPACPYCGGKEFAWPGPGGSQYHTQDSRQPFARDTQSVTSAPDAETATPDLDDLRAAAGHYTIKTTLRMAGTGSILFGGVAIYMGITNRHISELNVILALLGALLVVEGMWLSLITANVLLIVDGVALIILGIWNIMVSISNAAGTYSASPSTLWTMLAVSQIAWGVQSFLKYKRLRKAVSTSDPSPEAKQWVADAVEAVRSADRNNDADIVSLDGKPSVLLEFPKSWIGQLRDNLAVFVMTSGGSEVLVATQAEVNVKSKHYQKKSRKVTLSLGRRVLKGFMTPKHLDRLRSWKARLAGPANIAPGTFIPQPADAETRGVM